MSAFYNLLVQSDVNTFCSVLDSVGFDIRITPDKGRALAKKIFELTVLQKIKISSKLDRLVVASNYDPMISEMACLCLYSARDYLGAISIAEQAINRFGSIPSEEIAQSLICSLMSLAKWGDIDQFFQKHHVQFRSSNLVSLIVLAHKIRKGDVGVVCNQLTKTLELKFLLSAFNPSVLATSSAHALGFLMEQNELAILHEFACGGSVLDIGCLVGNHSIFFSKVCNARKVVSVDSEDTCCGLTSFNFALNGADLSCYSIVNARAGGDIPFSSVGKSLPQTSGFYLDLDCCKYDLVKVDIDGGEVELIKKSLHYFSQKKPVLMCEVGNQNIGVVEGLMRSVGFDCLPLTSRDAVAGDNNYLFKPN